MSWTTERCTIKYFCGNGNGQIEYCHPDHHGWNNIHAWMDECMVSCAIWDLEAHVGNEWGVLSSLNLWSTPSYSPPPPVGVTTTIPCLTVYMGTKCSSFTNVHPLCFFIFGGGISNLSFQNEKTGSLIIHNGTYNGLWAKFSLVFS